jgi:hypothetical protein
MKGVLIIIELQWGSNVMCSNLYECSNSFRVLSFCRFEYEDTKAPKYPRYKKIIITVEI